MCQIVYAPKKDLLIMEDLEVSQENNPDGFGITFAQNNRLFYCRKMGDFNLFKKALAIVPDNVPLVIHFRFTTHGETSKLNIHPFEVLNTLQGDSVDLCMAHNGTVGSIHTHGEKKSDTHLYIEKILRPILKESPSLVFNPAFQLLVQRDIGTHNKFIFLQGDGKVTWINKSAGHVPTSCSELWYANEYSLKNKYRSGRVSSYTSQEEHWRNKYPLLHAGVVEKPEPVKDLTVSHITSSSNQIENHVNTQFFNFSEIEKDVPEEIKALLKDDEQLLVNKYIDKVSLQGWGWVKYGQSSARWHKAICTAHKKWKLATDPDLRKQLGLETEADKTMAATEIKSVSESSIGTSLAKAEEQLTKQLEKMYDERDFRLMNESEVLNWVLEYPDEASEWAAKNGFYGSAKKITEWMQDAVGSQECVADFIYKVARKHNSFKTLTDIEEERSGKRKQA